MNPIVQSTKSGFLNYIKFAGILAILYLFLVSIGMIGAGFKGLGRGFAEQLMTGDAAPLIGLFIGILATSLIQSSSTTTSLVVGMVAAGTFGDNPYVAVATAIPYIMGANIGTSITNTIVSLGHIVNKNEFRRAFSASVVHDFFNVLAVLILFPLEMLFHGIQRSAEWIGGLMFGKIHNVDVLQAKSPIKVAIKSGAKFVEQFTFDNNIIYLVLSVFITFAMLYSLVKILRSLVLKKVEVFFDQYIFKTALRALGFGILLTIMVQSSSITTSTIVPLAGAGVLTLRQIFPFTLGANIGTTVTALLAAITGTVAALIAAISHLLFNIFGIIIIYGLPFLRVIPLKFAERIADYSIKNKLTPIVYLLIVFVAIPLSIILLGR